MKTQLLQERHGSRGVAHLRIAVLEVLYAAKQAGDCPGPAAISRRGGIFREAGYAVKQDNDMIVLGILNSLFKDRLVKRCSPKNSGWELTNKGLQECAGRDTEIEIMAVQDADKHIIDAYRCVQWGFCPSCLAVLPNPPRRDPVSVKEKSDSNAILRILCPNYRTLCGDRSLGEFLAKGFFERNSWTDYWIQGEEAKQKKNRLASLKPGFFSRIFQSIKEIRHILCCQNCRVKETTGRRPH